MDLTIEHPPILLTRASRATPYHKTLPPAVRRCFYTSMSQQRSPPSPEGSASSAGDTTAGGELTKGHQASPNGSGELPGAPYSTVAVSRPGTGGGGGGGGGSKSDFRPNTRVPPMLLLKSVPEAIMCQLVLTAWEQSSSSGRR